ncbi:hypothetical protein MHBO_003753, partial [Bonamia ostreae]
MSDCIQKKYRRVIFIFIASFVLPLAYFSFFLKMHFSSNSSKMIYCITVLIFLNLGKSLVKVPHSAMASELANDGNINKYIACRSFFSSFGSLLSTGIAIWVTTDDSDNESEKLTITGFYSAFFLFFCFYIFLILTRIPEVKKKNNENLRKCRISDIVTSYRHCYFIAISTMNFLFQICNQLVISNLKQYLEYYVHRKSWLIWSLVIMTSSNLFYSFFCDKTEKKLGTKNMLVLSMLLSILSFALFLCANISIVIILIAACFLRGISLSTSTFCLRKMLRFLINRDKRDGIDRKAIYIGNNGFISRIGSGVATLIISKYIKSSSEYFMSRSILVVMVYIPVVLN